MPLVDSDWVRKDSENYMAKKRVCMDPGHYGSKYNAGAVSGYYESAIVWKLTMLEKEILEKMGVEVVLTRTKTSDDPALFARGEMAKGCNLFISNHTNACDTPSVDRVEGIYLVDRDRTSIDETSKAFAGKLAAVVKQTMGLSSYRTYSRVATSDRDKNGKLDDNYYGVLHGAFMAGVPGVIIEHGFHTNPNTCKWLMNSTNLKKLAEACAKCIAEFLGASTASEPVAEKTTAKTTEVKATAYAKSLDKNLAGSYKTTADLHLRDGAGTKYKSLCVLPKGTKVQCYGYYTSVSGTKWLSIQVTLNKVKYTGFSSSKYLTK